MRYDNVLEFKEEKSEVVKYLGLVRQMFLAADISVCPKEVQFVKYEGVLSEPSYFTRRLSLLTHKIVSDKKVSEIKETVVLKNETDKRRLVYAKELNQCYKDVEVLEPNFILLILGPKQELSMNLTFEVGSGLEDAKYCTLQKLGFQFEHEPCKLKCRSIEPLEITMKKTTTLLNEQIDKLKKELSDENN